MYTSKEIRKKHRISLRLKCNTKKEEDKKIRVLGNVSLVFNMITSRGTQILSSKFGNISPE